jgi:hypothetical protein
VYVGGIVFAVVGVLLAVIAGPLARAFVDLGSERTERSSLRSRQGIEEQKEMLRSPDTYTMLVWGARAGGSCVAVVGIIAAFAHHWNCLHAQGRSPLFRRQARLMI